MEGYNTLKPELYNFEVDGKFFVLHPPTGTLLEVDKKTYDFCRFVAELGWEDARERFVTELTFCWGW
ncbi:hypothetical protein A3L08_01695 [Thermococcus pacificus]|uniref:Uncharacterized protein n=1 Tax=Thermococcus pacificus TaxID=71998 RepID=A0A218P5T0_9EURY|nr:hypothetical protein A3L08_01695 [Thermococcus pacificus]